MRRLKALLGKELRQHAGTGLGLAACLAGAWSLMFLGAWLVPETVRLPRISPDGTVEVCRLR